MYGPTADDMRDLRGVAPEEAPALTPQDRLDILRSYFDVADELDGGLRLEDLDVRFVAEAQAAGSELNLPWPPSLPEAEEMLLTLKSQERAAARSRCPLCGEPGATAVMYDPESGALEYITAHAACGRAAGLEVE